MQKNYYRRWTPDSKQFFVDDNGSVVDEATALAGNLVEETTAKNKRQKSTTEALTEADSDKQSTVAAYQRLGLTEAQARIAANAPAENERIELCARKMGLSAREAKAFAATFKM